MPKQANIDRVMLGPEPAWSTLEGMSVEQVNSMMYNAYRWYNYTTAEADRVKYLYDYLDGEDKKVAAVIKKASPKHLPSTVCWIARLASKGCPLPQDATDYFNRRVFDIYDDYKDVKTVRKIQMTEAMSVRARMLEKVGELVAELDQELDKFIANGCQTDFSAYKWLGENDIKGKPAALLAEYFRPLLEELKLLNSRDKDKDLVEGYVQFNRKQKKQYLLFVKALVDDIEAYSSNKKVARKPRKARSINAVSKVSKVTVMKKSDEYKLTSIDPINIIGADVAWVFNTKNRTLFRYQTNQAKGLTVSRSSIRGFDKDNSFGKKLHKVDLMLSKIKKGGKVASRKVIDNIAAKRIAGTGRLNEHTILLKVEK